MAAQVILFSGGMDSVALAHAYPDAVLLFVRNNTPICEQEAAHASKIGDALNRHILFRKVDLSGFELPNGILPFRNSIFALIAAQLAPVVLLGSTAGDTTRDKDETWATCMTGLLRYMSQDEKKNPAYWLTATDEVRVQVPFRSLTKTQILSTYLMTGGRRAPLELSRSCYTVGARECGRCRSCFRKWVAFKNNGVANLLDMESCPADFAAEHMLKDRGAESDDARRAME